MPGTLVVVESPTKAKTLEKYLGQGFIVRASYGHIRDLPKSKLGVDTDGSFEPEYVVPEASERAVRDLRAAMKKSDDVILATDYDREGEAIAFHVAEILKLDPTTAKRVTFTEITKDAILEAFRQPRGIDLRLVEVLIPVDLRAVEAPGVTMNHGASGLCGASGLRRGHIHPERENERRSHSF